MFLLDAAFLLLIWPFSAWVAVPSLNLRQNALLLLPAAIYPLSNMLSLYALGLYRRDIILKTRRALSRIPLVVGAGAVCATIAVILLSMTLLSVRHALHGPIPATLFVAASVSFTFCGVAARLLFLGLRRSALLRPRLLVIGAGRRAWDVMWLLRSEGRNLHYDVTFLHKENFGTVDPRLAGDATVRIMQTDQPMLEIVKHCRADQIVVAPDERRGMTLDELIACKTAGFPVLQYMSFLETEIRRIDVKRLDASWILYSEGFSFGLIDRILKRALDIIVSLILLTISSPFLLAGMLAVKLGDGGPVFYRQTRITRGMKPFQILKLRTMRVDSEAGGAVWAAAADRRITAAGAFLRRTRLDELPQLFNVLKGEMSLVGPRPERPEFTRSLAEQLPLYNERHMVKAGLTGWAQINYPYGASLDDARSKLSYDLYYVKNFSIFLDVLIILQT
ncbi:MAG TPA: TIGR03013 family XrtA/PEP-CTERM system glycosyltransferase, partial [Acetobacteraceae bacterium]|nr:TIGR03013 family XrtA/PEP-CTERM system glycosyltransferase [Acetobacteraceae bacterium]